MTIERETLQRFLRDMLLARVFEERAAEEYAKGNIVGFLHLYPGEDAVGVGLIPAAGPADYIVSTYREHAHALARGVPPEKVMAELFGRIVPHNPSSPSKQRRHHERHESAS